MQLPSRVIITGSALAVAAAGMLAGFSVGVAQPRQPHMAAALNALRTARAELQTADPDKAGHRAAAIGLVDQAMGQVQAGIAAGAF
jgi:hypothetical protein